MPDTTFAIIETGGKQYQVAEGDIITVEKLQGVKKGDDVVFDKVLLVDNGHDTQIGDPYLEGAKVKGKLQEEGRGKKLEVVRYRAKSRYLKRKSHRQPFAKVEITSIS